jgi:hypothetical protein
MSRSVDRARPERDLVKRCRYGRFDTRRERRARLSARATQPRVRFLPQSLSIRVVDAHPYAHHPVSTADIQEILTRLKDTYVDSITQVLLLRGTQEDLDPDPEGSPSGYARDPWINRRGHELLPGFFFGHTLGMYYPSTATIHLHSIVFEPGHFAMARWQALLRLRMLDTLVHEVGHHRWSRDGYARRQQPNSEEYAVSYAATMVPKVVIPYLVQNYRIEIDLLLSWLERQVGIRLSFATLLPDRSNAEARAFSGLTSGCAVENLAEAVAGGDDRHNRRVNFARHLHYGARYAEALQILDLLPADVASDFNAADLRACILRDQGRLREARSLARWLTIRFRTDYDAWKRLADVCGNLKDWTGVVEATTVQVNLANASRFGADQAYLDRARGYTRLGALDAALADLDQMSPRDSGYIAKQMTELRAEIEAKAATGGVASPAISPTSHLLTPDS